MADPADDDDDLPIFPLIGTYVALCINPQTTLAALDDPAVNELTKKIKPKFYAGYVFSVEGLIDDDEQFQVFRVRLLREGLPPPVPKDFLESDMCTPVWPTTMHPSQRSPLQTSRPLPWANCYHSSFDSTAVRIYTNYANADKAVRISSAEILKHDEFIDADKDRVRDAHRLQHALRGQEDKPLSEEGLEMQPESPARSVYGGSDPGSIPEHLGTDVAEGQETEAEPQDDTKQFLANFMGMLEWNSPPETMTTVEMSYNLKVVKKLTDPQEFFAEEEVLKKIERDCRVNAIEKARRLDEEAFGSKPEPAYMKHIKSGQTPATDALTPTQPSTVDSEAPAETTHPEDPHQPHGNLHDGPSELDSTAATKAEDNKKPGKPWLSRARQRLASLLTGVMGKFRRGSRKAAPAVV